MILSTARRIQIIADTIANKDTPRVDPNIMGDPWSVYYKWVTKWIDEDPDDIDVRELRLEFVQQFCSISEEHATRVKLILNAIDEPLAYPNAGEIIDNLPDLEWLWPNWLPLGLVSLLAAVPGTGKSYLALDLAYRIIRNDCFPDDSPVPAGDHSVIYVDAENTPSIFKARVQPWTSSELARIYLMLPDQERLVINLDDILDRERLWDMIYTIQPVLTIIDSYGSATLRGENNKEDVQTLLAFLNKLAKDNRMGMLIVHHLRKRSGPQQSSFLPMTIDSIRGSSHIPAMARNVLGLQWIPASYELDENGPRRLWVMKSNLTRYPDPLGVYFDPHPEIPDIALLRYGEAPEPYREMTKGDYCAEWLEELLRNSEEPLSPKEIFELGKEEGFNKRMISRVRQQMGNQIRNTEEDVYNHNNKWEWSDEE